MIQIHSFVIPADDPASVAAMIRSFVERTGYLHAFLLGIKLQCHEGKVVLHMRVTGTERGALSRHVKRLAAVICRSAGINAAKMKMADAPMILSTKPHARQGFDPWQEIQESGCA